MSSEIANDIKNNIEKIIYNPCYVDASPFTRSSDYMDEPREGKDNENNQ